MYDVDASDPRQPAAVPAIHLTAMSASAGERTSDVCIGMSVLWPKAEAATGYSLGAATTQADLADLQL